MIILNEKKFAEKCIKEKKIEGRHFQTLSIIANYYYSTEGLEDDKLRDKLTSFFIKSDPVTYISNKKKWNDAIDTIISNLGKYPLHEIDGVWITAKELAKIRTLKNKRLERLAFTLLCLAKFYNMRNPNNNNWVSMDYMEIYKLARIQCKKIERYSIMSELYKRGFIELAKRVDNLSVQLLFVDDAETGDVFISDFRELGYEYQNLQGEYFIKCEKCGKLVKDNKYKKRKYCNDCSTYIPQNTKLVECVDCGKSFIVSSKNTKTCRCEDCQNKKNSKDSAIRMRKHRSVS